MGARAKWTDALELADELEEQADGGVVESDEGFMAARCIRRLVVELREVEEALLEIAGINVRAFSGPGGHPYQTPAEFFLYAQGAARALLAKLDGEGRPLRGRTQHKGAHADVQGSASASGPDATPERNR
jgi:hypothetical protein